MPDELVQKANRVSQGGDRAAVFYYNFSRKHSTLKGKTPAMAAGIATTIWSVRDMLFATDQITPAA